MYLCLGFLSVFFCIGGFVLLRHAVRLDGVVVAEDGVQVVQTLAFDQELSLQLLHRVRTHHTINKMATDQVLPI